MPIIPFRSSASFSPEAITLMALAFERTCQSLRVAGQPVRAEAVARKVLELAQAGERDPVRMSERTVASLRIQA